MPDISKAKAGSHEMALLSAAIRDYHSDLDVNMVTVGLEFASITEKAREKGKFAVTLHGYGCKAVVKIVKEDARRYGSPDAVIRVDRDVWDDMVDKERIALLDHELTHLTIQRDDSGIIKFDNCKRPILKMRLHDVDFGWFREVAERHRQYSTEAQQACKMLESKRNVQSIFYFMGDSAFQEGLERNLKLPITDDDPFEDEDGEYYDRPNPGNVREVSQASDIDSDDEDYGHEYPEDEDESEVA